VAKGSRATEGKICKKLRLQRMVEVGKVRDGGEAETTRKREAV
jgi:hypothetical protein